MPRGIGDIPNLRLEVLQNFTTKFTSPPDLKLQNMFPSMTSPSSTIKWESKVGSRGMSPLMSPGSPTQKSAPAGISQNSFEAAMWGEKQYYDEQFLNNLRKPGTEDTYQEASQTLAENMMDMTIKCYRRKEWLFAKMLTVGSFDYKTQSETTASVDYNIPSTHIVTLGTDYQWEKGTNRNIINDIITARETIDDDCGANASIAMCNGTVFKYMANDSGIRTLLQKSTFGDGNLFDGNIDAIVGANPQIVADLLGIGQLIIYREKYEVRANLTAAVTADSTTTISVDEATDFEVGGTVKFVDVSAGTSESETISAVDERAGTITVTTAPSTSYRANEDYVTMIRPYIPNDKFIMFAPSVEGKPSIGYKQAPFGNDRRYGVTPKRWDNIDPDGVNIRVQDKGLPIMWQPDAIYILDVN